MMANYSRKKRIFKNRQNLVLAVHDEEIDKDSLVISSENLVRLSDDD